MSKIVEVDENCKMILDCQSSEYIENLIGLTKKAQTEGNKHMIRVYANELEKYKTLCGNHPLLEQFERQLSFTADKLGLSTCPAIQRALAPANPSTKPVQTSLGFEGMLNSAFGKSTKKEPPQSPATFMSPSQRQLEASEFGGAQNTVQSAITSQEEKVVTRNRRMGFRGMLDEAFPEGTERMLPKDNPYIAAKPPKNGIFSWKQEKKDIDPYGLLVLLKNRLAIVKKEGKELLVGFYEKLISDLERTLGIVRQQQSKSPPVLLSGLERMLYASTHGGSQVERNLDTSNAHQQKRNALNIRWGFRSMLNGAFPTSKPTEERVRIFKTGDRFRSMVGFTEVELIVTPKGILRHFKE